MTDGTTNGVGIYDDFPGFRLPTDSELDSALRSALVVVDANVLLNLYRYNESTRDDLLELLRRVGERLWVPHQVIREFWRNRLGVLASRGAGTDQALAALSKQQRATTDTILQWAKTVAIDNTERDNLLQKVAALHADLESKIRLHAPSAPAVVGGAASDPVIQQLQPLLAGKVGAAPAQADWEADVKIGNDRASRQLPPGYLDADKADSELPEGAAGDYLVWHQMVVESSLRSIDVLLVTGDEKEDWWWRHRSEFLGPRTELVDELKAACGKQLYMMRPIDLLRRASALGLVIRKESVDDVERVSQESQPRGALYTAFWERFLERLRTSHPGWSRARKGPADNWLSLPSPSKGGWSSYTVSFPRGPEGQQLRCELYIDSSDPAEVEQRFGELYEHREAIEAAFGDSLSWEPLEGRRASRIAAYGPGDITEGDQHDEYIDWFLSSFERLRAALDPYLARA
jgi:hypothetical protein